MLYVAFLKDLSIQKIKLIRDYVIYINMYLKSSMHISIPSSMYSRGDVSLYVFS